MKVSELIHKCFVFAVLLLIPVCINAQELSSEQRDMVQDLGYPGSFTILLIADDNDPVLYHRLENWSYYEHNVSFIFYDGDLASHEKIEDLPGFSFMPKFYRSEQFKNGMSLDEVKNKIIGKKSYSKVNLPKEIMPSVQMVGSEQIMFGFLDDKLVYVETIPLISDEEGGE